MDDKMYTGGGGNTGGGWGPLLGAGFGAFLGSMFGNGGFFGGGNANGAAVAAANQGTDSLSRQILAGQQEQQMQSAIAGVNSRIDGIGGQLQAQASASQMQSGFTGLGAQLGGIGASVNDFALAMKDCCCNMKTTTLEQGYQNQLASERQTNAVQAGQAQLGNIIQQGFTGNTYQIQQAVAALQAAGTANTQKILDWLCNSKQLQDATTIQQLRDEVGRLNQSRSIVETILNNLKTTTTGTTAGA